MDIVKGIAILLVVYGHIIQHAMAPWGHQEFYLNPVFKIIYTFHMPLFVFISGYLTAYSINRFSGLDYFKKKVKSLLVPFISLGILSFMVSYILNVIFANGANAKDMAGGLVDQLVITPAIWFLWTLFVLNCSLIISVKLEKRFGVIIFAVIYFVIMSIPYNNYCDLYYIKWFNLFYLAGYFSNRYSVKISNLVSQSLFLVLSFLMFSWFLGYWTRDDYIYINQMNLVSSHYSHEFLRIAYRYMMGFWGIAMALGIGGYLLKTKLGPILEEIGVYSLDIYIIQMFFLEGIYPRLISRTHIQLDFNSLWVCYILAPLATIFFTIVFMLCSKFWIRKNSLLNMLFLGGRT